MGKGILNRAATYAKNLGKHVGRVVTRNETAGTALQGLTRDTKKLGRSLTGKAVSSHHRDSSHLVKEGREAYNAHNYELAAEKFRSAIVEDKNNAWAYTYLGHTLYKQGRTQEAASYWRQAVQIDTRSEAAVKAMQKLRMLEKKKENMNEWIHDQSEHFK